MIILVGLIKLWHPITKLLTTEEIKIVGISRWLTLKALMLLSVLLKKIINRQESKKLLRLEKTLNSFQARRLVALLAQGIQSNRKVLIRQVWAVKIRTVSLTPCAVNLMNKMYTLILVLKLKLIAVRKYIWRDYIGNAALAKN